ncbi:hypothetical protein ABPG75_008782 [Micractinium tetrahymenae]
MCRQRRTTCELPLRNRSEERRRTSSSGKLPINQAPQAHHAANGKCRMRASPGACSCSVASKSQVSIAGSRLGGRASRALGDCSLGPWQPPGLLTGKPSIAAMSGPQRRGLLPQLSGSLGRGTASGGAGSASSTIDPELRAAFARRTSSGVGGSFAAQAALLGAGQPEATLAMFRRLNAEQEASRDVGRGSKLAQHDAVQPGARTAGLPGPGSDSAWHTEAEGEEAGSFDSQASSAQAQGWAGLQAHGGGYGDGAAAEQGPAAPGMLPPDHRAGSPGGGSNLSAFAPASAHQFSGLPDSSRGGSPLPRSPARQWQHGMQEQGSQLRAELLRQLPSALAALHPALSVGSARSAAAESAFYSAAGGGGGTAVSGLETPRSAVSWASALTLPQTESDLAQLDLDEVRQLAAEAEALQQRAALALRLARLRMGGEGGGAGSGGDSAGAAAPGGGGAAVRKVPITGVAPAVERAGRIGQQQEAQQQRRQPREPPCEERGTVQHAQGQWERAQGQGHGHRLEQAQPALLAQAEPQAEAWEPEGPGRPPQPLQQPQKEQQEWEAEHEPAGDAAGPAAAASTAVARAGAAASTAAAGAGTHVAASAASTVSEGEEAAHSRAAPASALPAPVQVALQLVVLAAAVLEAALLWGASMAERASGSVLHVPRALVQAPPAALRCGVMVAAVLLELLACLLRALRR